MKLGGYRTVESMTNDLNARETAAIKRAKGETKKK